MILTDLSLSEIEAGQPLKHSVFDRDRKLLLSQGNLVSAALYDKLTRLGAYQLSVGGQPPADAPNPAAQAMDARTDAESDAHPDRSAGPTLAPHVKSTVAAGWHTCTALSPPRAPGVRSTMTPAALFSRWLDFMHITDGVNGDAVSCRLSLLGVIDGTCLMATSATLERDWGTMTPGRRLHATVFDGRRIYTFDTAIAGRFDVPFRYLHLSYPTELCERPPRRSLRAAVALECVLMHDGEAVRQSTRAMITDLSAMSAGIRTPNLRIAIGARVLLSFAVTAGDAIMHPMRIPAIVRRRNIDTRSDIATYGLEFTEMPDELRAPLQDFVARAIHVH